MKWLLGVFSQAWNRARKRRGHVLQGRYKAVPVNGPEADPPVPASKLPLERLSSDLRETVEHGLSDDIEKSSA